MSQVPPNAQGITLGQRNLPMPKAWPQAYYGYALLPQEFASGHNYTASGHNGMASGHHGYGACLYKP